MQTYTEPLYVEDFYILGDYPEGGTNLRIVQYEARFAVVQSETKRTKLE